VDRRAWLLVAVPLAAFAAWIAVWGRAEPRAHRGGDSRVTGGCQGAPGQDLAGSAHAARPPAKTVRDPAVRAATREALRERLGTRYPAPAIASAPRRAPPPAKPPPAADPGEAPAPAGSAAGKMDPKYIQERVREDFFPLARDCYDRALRRNPKLGGKVELHFTIVGDERVGGIVEDSFIGDGSTLHDEEFETCVTESMMSLAFAPPRGGGTVTVTYPIEFSTDDDDGGANDAGAKR
jgi:hypothetical protein